MAVVETANDYVCGGTLINQRFVLTAAHCMCKSNDCKDKHNDLFVRLGVHNRTTDRESGHLHERFRVVNSHLHPNFEHVNSSNDIALLELERNVIYSHQIKPICVLLDGRQKIRTDDVQRFTAAGWGKTESKDLSDVLKSVQINRIEKIRCIRHFWRALNDAQICGGTGNLADTCQGDSGGPLYSKSFYGGVWRNTQFGIISYGSEQCGGLGVYTDVMSHIDFIKQIVLMSDIKVLLPKIDLLDRSCLDDGKLPTSERSGPDTFPWLAEVYFDSFLLSYGALISNRFVVTTAQFIPANSSLKVILGEDTYKVKTVHIHNDFVDLGKNNIALLELERKVQYTELIKPICLPSPKNKIEQIKFQKKAKDEQNLTVVGISKAKLIRRMVSSECYNQDYQEIGDGQMCMEHPNTVSIAMGSPLVKPLRHGNSRAFTLVGLAGFGRLEDHSPDVYTNVLSYMDWIGAIV
ncbi:polyserase-2 isoform X2 [Drosophila eugracilis]|nr:polyserase-2 isoform X2 [Drosophila eugracilis]